MKYNTATVDVICKTIEDLKGRFAAVKTAGISYETFTQWMEKYPEFVERIKEAERRSLQKGKEYAIMAIFRAMDKQWQAGAWFLERKFKDEFAARTDLNASGTMNFVIKTIRYDDRDNSATQLQATPVSVTVLESDGQGLQKSGDGGASA